MASIRLQIKSNKMKKRTLSEIESFLKVDFTYGDTLWLTSGYTLRKLVGILGMALPLLLWLVLVINNGHTAPLESISHYFFTRASSVFSIILGTIAIFLMVYKGEKSVDFYVSLTAGFFALCVLLFPTGNITSICGDVTKKYSVTILPASTLRENFHYASAGIFLLCLAGMSMFIFTKSDKPKNRRGARKILRNRIYRTCGVIMAASMLVILSGMLELIPPAYYDSHHITFWMETLAVESFGFSWLVKGRTLLRDREEEEVRGER